MTIEQIEIIMNIHYQVTFLPGSWDKRFIRGLFFDAREKELTEGQNEWLYRILYKYRRQVPRTYEKHKSNPLCSRKPDKAPKLTAQAIPAAAVPYQNIVQMTLNLNF